MVFSGSKNYASLVACIDGVAAGDSSYDASKYKVVDDLIGTLGQVGLEINITSQGDSAGIDTVRRLGSGMDNLHIGFAKVEGGGRNIYLAGLSNGIEGAIDLAHEAWRSGGTTTSGELLRAATSHTNMASALGIDMFRAIGMGRSDLARDRLAMMQGAESFAAYVGDAYDNSDAFWKLTKDGGLQEILSITDPNLAARLITVIRLKADTNAKGYDANSPETWIWNTGDADKKNLTSRAYVNAPSSLMFELAVTGRFSKENMYSSLVRTELLPERWDNPIEQAKSLFGFNPIDYKSFDTMFESEYANSLVDKTLNQSSDFLSIGNLTRSGESLNEMRGIAVHWNGMNTGQSSQAIRNYFAEGHKSNSTFAIGPDGKVLQMLPYGEKPWTSGGRYGGSADTSLPPYATEKMQELFPINSVPFGAPDKYTESIEVSGMANRLKGAANAGFWNKDSYDANHTYEYNQNYLTFIDRVTNYTKLKYFKGGKIAYN